MSNACIYIVILFNSFVNAFFVLMLAILCFILLFKAISCLFCKGNNNHFHFFTVFVLWQVHTQHDSAAHRIVPTALYQKSRQKYGDFFGIRNTYSSTLDSAITFCAMLAGTSS